MQQINNIYREWILAQSIKTSVLLLSVCIVPETGERLNLDGDTAHSCINAKITFKFDP